MAFERLPSSVVPVQYDLHLTPNLTNFTFEGSVDIEVMVQQTVDHFILNAADLQIHSCEYSPNNGETINLSPELNEKEETLTIKFNSPLNSQKGTLSFRFTGTLNDQMRGFYRAKYSLNGEERYSAVTQFESTDARRAFPCWDEPAIKSRFKVTITAPSDRVVLSNMPELTSSDNKDGTKTVEFENTPIMSTYLVAFIVGEFDFIETTTSEGRVLVRVFVPVGQKEQGRFALEMAARTLPFYEEWFGVRYPLPKVDLIAIPDFASGAMENWGLMTYRETALLVDEKGSSASGKQWVALVVAHELAHQWFGNIVTMEWWTHLWLNEGFASWMEYLATDYSYPEWEMWKYFVYQDMGSAFSLDALRTSHPIEVPVSNPEEIDEIFDSISYSKGSTVIRMLYSFLGEEDFKQGLREYLMKHQYANAMTEDLWEALENVSKKPVKEMMDTWTKQMGYPVVTVTQLSETRIQVEQHRFLASTPTEEDDMSSLWFIPIRIISDSCPESDSKVHLFNQRKMELDLPAGSWYKLNADQTGFYRVRYASESMRKSLSGAIKEKQLTSVTDRLGIQNDAVALARAGVMKTTDALELIMAYVNEDDYNVWADLTSNISSLIKLLSFYPDSDKMIDVFGCKLYQIIGKQVGWDAKESDTVSTIQLRSLVLGQLGKYGDEDTVAEANKRFQAYLEDNESLSADLRSTVYRIVLQHGNEATFDSILSIMRQTNFQEEKERCMYSLGATKNTQCLKRALELSLSSEIRSQDAQSVICAVARNTKGRELAWSFLKENWEKLTAMYKGGYLFNSLVKGVVRQFSTEEQVKEIRTFFESRSYSSRSLNQALEIVQTNAAWMSRDHDNIMQWLQELN